MRVLCAANDVGFDMTLADSTLDAGFLKWQRLLRSRDADMVTGSSSSKMEPDPASGRVSAATESARAPVTSRMPIVPPYGFSQAPLQVLLHSYVSSDPQWPEKHSNIS